MTTNNRHRKCIHDPGNNPPGLAHENALTISNNSDVEEDYRTRKSSGAGNSSPKSYSDIAFNWLCQSGLVSVPWLLDPREPSPQPPGEAPPGVRHSASGQVPIHACNALGQLLQSSPSAVRRVRRMLLVRPPFSGNHSAQSDPFCEANKQLFSHRSNGSIGRDALVNGSSSWVLIRLPLGRVKW